MPQIPWFIVLLILSLGGFVIFLFLPTLWELKKPRDSGPRKIAEISTERVPERGGELAKSPKLPRAVKEGIPEGLRHALIDLDGKEISKLGINTIRIVGDTELPSGIEIRENLIVEGSLKIGDRCCFHRNVKASKDVEIGNDVLIGENLIVGGRLSIENGTVIKGLVNAESSVCLGQNVSVGLSLASGGNVELNQNTKVAKSIVSRGYIRVSQRSKIERD